MPDGRTWRVDDAIVLLGERRALARETALQLLALFGLLLLGVAGILAVVPLALY